jgi:Predicted membrane-associated, metal-dependent hydrolase
MLRFLRYRPTVSRLTYILLFALYIALALNVAFYRQAWSLLPVNTFHNGLVFFTMPLVAFSVMVICLALASFLRLEKVLTTLFILLSASAQYFIMTFGVIIDRSMITNILDTTPAESYALMSGKMILTLLFTAVLFVALAWWIKIKAGNTEMA